MSKVEARKVLENSLVRRVPTWVVADAILSLGVVDKSTPLFSDVSKLAKEQSWLSGDMNDDFDIVDPADTQLAVLGELFPALAGQVNSGESVYSAGYVARQRALLSEAMVALVGDGSVSAGTALKERYTLVGYRPSEVSKKAFVKRIRFLSSFEEKLVRVENKLNLRHAQMQAKSRLAYDVDVSGMDDVSLAFVAYLASRANRRSLFMLGGQSKAFDNITDGLRALLKDDSAWEQIAFVSPTTNVFSHLDGAALGRMIQRFHSEMVFAANALGALFPSLPERMRDEMVMVRGVDSSSWNAYAGALNTMRSAWISATLAAGLGEVFDSYLPGKAPRLMAADVVWWARNSGEALHEDTRMFSTLPYPWEVISGKKMLNREMTLSTASSLGVVDVEKSGWVGPRKGVLSEAASAEPATVYGVVVSDPALAKVFRKAKIYSGQNVKFDVIPEDLTVAVVEEVINR